MLIVISPAKTLDFESPVATSKHTQPVMLDDAVPLVERARTLSAADLSALMGISDKLAKTNVDRFKSWSRPFTPDNARPAAFAFRGDVYQGLGIDDFGARDLDWAQKHLRILSGLYGVLRPLDLIQPYRLEMGLPLSVDGKKDLYAYWNGRITDELNETMRESKSRVLINLASKEYFGAVDTARVDATVITPSFKELRDGTLRLISFAAKRARGLMARYIITNRLKKPADLQSFDLERYRFRKTGSTDDAPLFTRRGATKK